MPIFAMYKGQCPGAALDGDWRARLERCAVWFALFEHREEVLLSQGKSPLSCHEARHAFENALLTYWTAGRPLSLTQAYFLLSQSNQGDPDAEAVA